MNAATPDPPIATPTGAAPPRRSGRPRRASTPIRGDERAALSKRAAQLYPELRSIRKVAQRLGKSPGLVWGLLQEAGVELQPANGANKASHEPAAD